MCLIHGLFITSLSIYLSLVSHYDFVQDFRIHFYESTCQPHSRIGSAKLRPLHHPLKNVTRGDVELDVKSESGADVGRVSGKMEYK